MMEFSVLNRQPISPKKSNTTTQVCVVPETVRKFWSFQVEIHSILLVRSQRFPDNMHLF